MVETFRETLHSMSFGVPLCSGSWRPACMPQPPVWQATSAACWEASTARRSRGGWMSCFYASTSRYCSGRCRLVPFLRIRPEKSWVAWTAPVPTNSTLIVLTRSMICSKFWMIEGGSSRVESAYSFVRMSPQTFKPCRPYFYMVYNICKSGAVAFGPSNIARKKLGNANY